MSFVHSLKKYFKGIRWLKHAKRIFDDKPIHCSFFVTDRCNLDCAYCNEYDNSQAHPTLEDLKRRIDKVADLGVIKTALVGGEPLLHPQIDQVIRHAKSKGMATSISTNGYLLNEKMVDRLVAAGLDTVQISIDRKTASSITRKAIEKIHQHLDYLLQTNMKVHLSGIICEDTADESEAVLNYGLNRGIPTQLRLLHGDADGRLLTKAAPTEKGKRLIDLQIRLKEEGKPIHTRQRILDYQRETLEGKQTEWTCLAGYKIFFVSAQGDFWLCSQVRTNKKIEEVTPEDLKSYDHKKDCQTHCGIYCVISNSLFVQNPIAFTAREVPCKVKQILRKIHAS